MKCFFIASAQFSIVPTTGISLSYDQYITTDYVNNYLYVPSTLNATYSLITRINLASGPNQYQATAFSSINQYQAGLCQVAIDHSRNTLYVSSATGNVQASGVYVFSLTNGAQTNFISSTINIYCGLAINSVGNLYWGNPNGIQKYAIATQALSYIYTGTAGDPTYDPTTNALYFLPGVSAAIVQTSLSTGNSVTIAGSAFSRSKPCQIAVDCMGNIYIADEGSNKVYITVLSTGATSVFGTTTGPVGLSFDGTMSKLYVDNFGVQETLSVASTGVTCNNNAATSSTGSFSSVSSTSQGSTNSASSSGGNSNGGISSTASTNSGMITSQGEKWSICMLSVVISGFAYFAVTI